MVMNLHQKVVEMNKDNAKFIITQDKATADLFIKQGLHVMPKQGKYYMFVNDPTKMTFDYDAHKVSYTNMLNF